jgi:Arc/MetJ family transcription regulator
MKTAISLPDDVFAAADARAATMGLSRSAFYTEAARRYLRELDQESFTEQVHQAMELETRGARADSAEFSRVGRDSLARRSGDEDW